MWSVSKADNEPVPVAAAPMPSAVAVFGAVPAEDRVVALNVNDDGIAEPFAWAAAWDNVSFGLVKVLAARVMVAGVTTAKVSDED